MQQPLIVTADPALGEELVRLSAAAGVTPELANEGGVALRSWMSAPLVLVGVDVAESLVRLAPPRRAGVHVVTWAGAPHEVFRWALALGAHDVVELPRSESWVVEALTDLVDPVRARGLTLGVTGGSGGAGATTLACALGQVAARDGPALVIDVDPGGPGLDRVLGLEDADGIRWEALHETTGRLSARALRDAVPTRSGLGVLTWGPGRCCAPQPFAAREALSAAQRGYDTVVLDLPRSTDGLVDELVSRCDQLVVVSRATVLGLSSTSRLLARLPGALPQLVVRGAGVPIDEVASVTGVRAPLAMADQRHLDEAVDLGLGPVRARRGALARVAAEILQAAARRGSG